MSYDSREKSRHGGQPVEGYRFTKGTDVWLYTSADRALVLPAGTFAPETIARSAMDFSQEDTGETLEVTMPRTNPVAALFINSLPSTPVWLNVFRAHRGDEDLAVSVFSGRIVRVRFEESEAILTATGPDGPARPQHPDVGYADALQSRALLHRLRGRPDQLA